MSRRFDGFREKSMMSSTPGIWFARMLLLLLLTQLSASSHAVIPQTAKDDPLYAKGYLVVTYYPGVYKNETSPSTTRAGLQEAMDDAFANSLVTYFPEGTYLIDNQLICHTLNPEETSLRIAEGQYVLIGSTLGARPLIKLKAGASGYQSQGTPKAVIEFKNFASVGGGEQEDSMYYEMLRGINIDCNGNPGAYGMYFNSAQDCSIENVKVFARGAYAGFIGLPSAGWGAVNIEVEGGEFGIDTLHTSNAGAIIAGAVLKDQKQGAIRHDSFVPITLVGFEIVTPSDSTGPAITIPAGGAHNNSSLSLIDGSITCTTPPSVAAIVNTLSSGANLYIRNVSIKGTDNLIKSGTQPKVTASGTWKRIDEYNYCNQSGPDAVDRISQSLINGTLGTTPEPVKSITPDAQQPEWDLVLRHIWASLPSVDDTDYVDASTLGIVPGDVSSTAFQTVIDNNQKIFLRPGVYMLNAPGIELRSDTILFGAARHLSRIEPRVSWRPTSEVPIIATEDSAYATTYLGDLAIGVNITYEVNSVFNAVDWKVGGDSMLHIARPYRFSQWGVGDLGGPRSLMRIRNGGGGRWYFAGCGDGQRTEDPDYRILKVEGTTQPLSMYGLNLEHGRGDIYAEFNNAKNVRIYGVKTEYEGNTTAAVFCPLISFIDTFNAAMFGHGAIRHSAGTGRGNIEVLGTSDRIAAALIAPQNGGGPTGSYTVLDGGRTPKGVPFLDCVSLYKRGEFTPEDETAMKHAHIGYATLPSEWSRMDIGTGQKAGSTGFGSGVMTIRGSGVDIFGSSDSFHYVYKTLNGDCEISARILSQQPVGTYPKAGLMIRETTDAGSKFAHWLIQKTEGVSGAGTRFQSRETTNSPAATLLSANGTEVAPYWMKLRRKGDTFTFFKSVDGSDWAPVGSQSIPMNSSITIGLAVCSNDITKLNAATFDNVNVQENEETAARSWQEYAISD